jgi:hypothetical protein
MLTITVDRTCYGSPAEAHDAIMMNKYLARLLTKELGIRRWLWVLEPQMADGEGWPHWHVLIDVSELETAWIHRETGDVSKVKPSGRQADWRRISNYLDLRRINRLLRQWGVGGCHLSSVRERYASSSHAINSITSYMLKMRQDTAFPPWMLERVGMRMVQSSRSVSALVNASRRRRSAATARMAVGGTRRRRRCHAERLAACGEVLELTRRSQFGTARRRVFCTMAEIHGLDGVQHLDLYGNGSSQTCFVGEENIAGLFRFISSPVDEDGGPGGRVITRDEATQRLIEERATRMLGWRHDDEDEDGGNLIEQDWEEDEWFEIKPGQADQATGQ